MRMEELRKKIDEVDTKIVKLIAERIRIAEQVGKEKKKQGIQIEDREREKVVLEKVKSIAHSENISQEDLGSIYRQIITVSRGMQGAVVAFQGEIGAYSEEAAFGFLGSSIQGKP